jgi:ATP-dependent DNA helicase RecG
MVASCQLVPTVSDPSAFVRRPPGLIPHVHTVTDPGTGRQVAIVTVEAGYADHARWHNKHFFCCIRTGRQSREASPDELSRLQQQCAELRPISGTSYEDPDQRRLADYFQRVRGQAAPERHDRRGWVQLLSATEFLVQQSSAPRFEATGDAPAGCRRG